MPGRGTAVGVLVLRQEASMVDWRRAEGQQPGVHGREIGEGQVVRTRLLTWSELGVPEGPEQRNRPQDLVRSSVGTAVLFYLFILLYQILVVACGIFDLC